MPLLTDGDNPAGRPEVQPPVGFYVPIVTETTPLDAPKFNLLRWAATLP